MLWYDNDKKRSLEEKVQRAADFYAAKYGRAATECYVHPSMLAPDGAVQTAAGLRLRPMRTIIKNHFWLGVEESKGAKAKA